MLYELVMLKKPFDGITKEIIDQVLKMDYTPFPKSTDNRLTKLLKLMLTPERNYRPSAIELLQLTFIQDKINYILENKLFPIDEEILYRLMSEEKVEIDPKKKEDLKDIINDFREDIEKSKQFYKLFSISLQLDINAINKTTYQKSYFSKKYENVVKGSDLSIIASDYNISDETLTNLIKMKFIINVTDPNETEFLDDEKNYYQIVLLQDNKVDNSIVYLPEFQPKTKNSLKLTQECLELAMTILQKLEEEDSEGNKEEILKSKDYFDFMVEIKQIKNIKFNELKKNEKLACILNIYQTMFIHYFIKLELGEIGGSNTGGAAGILSKMKGLVYAADKKIEIVYDIGGYKMSLYELKHITIRRNKKPFDAYFKLVSDGDAKIKLIEESENTANKLLFICLDPPLVGSFVDLNVEYNFQKFSDDVNEEVNNFIKDFITSNVQIDEVDIIIPKFLKNYLLDFSNSEQELVKFLYKNHSEASGKISTIIKAMNNKTANINYN